MIAQVELDSSYDTADGGRKSVERIEAVRESADGNGNATGAALFVTDAETPIGAYGDLSMVDEQLEVLGLRNVFCDSGARAGLLAG